MGPELEFSIIDAPSVAILQPLLDQFTATHGIPVRLRVQSWDTAWSELVRIALGHAGPDLSEIGSTWLGDLIGMNAVYQFSAAELDAIGPPSAFLANTWEWTRLLGRSETWAVPWSVDVRLLFYRRSLLARAGVAEATAFQTAAQLDQTLGRLQASGVRVPWVVPTSPTHGTLLNAASWVWGAGGDFLTPDGRQTLFNEPRARAGLRAYFALGRYLAGPVRHFRGDQPELQFLHDAETAMTISGPWLFAGVAAGAHPALAPDLGVALPPGPAFVGGSHLVIWKHSPQPDAALALLRFLMQPEAQITYNLQAGMLPARLEALAAEPFAGNPWWQTAIQAAYSGRSFPVTPNWGHIEYRLISTLGTLWAEILANPALDLDAGLAKHLNAVAARLTPLLTQP